MKKKNFREIYMPNLFKLMQSVMILEEFFKTGFPKLFKHIQDNLNDSSLFPLFGGAFISIFIKDLYHKYPETLAKIFDLFLLFGQ
jgi:hypothetical protein